MEQMATSSSGESDQMAKLSKAPAGIGQGLSSHPPLKCPRCDSSNTKFCYYNNYSQAQPRHFCKNCRRYWTQGGMLRNVPVGGGCRKNKRVRPRSLIAMGALDHDATSGMHMLGRLSSIPSFANACDDSSSSSQLLNIAFARFQETLRQPQPPAQTAADAALPYPDMSLPALVHKPCGISSCTGTACSGLMMDGFEHGLGFQQALHADHGFHRSSYEMPNPALYSHTHNLMATSATATLDSLEDELSSFSNFQYHVNPINCDVSPEEKPFNLPACSAPHWLLARPPSLEHAGSHLSYVEAPLRGGNADLPSENAEDEKPIKENVKPMIDMNGQNRLSLLMPADNNWQHQQQPSSMNEIMFNESHHGMVWPTNTARWQDMHTTSVL